MPKNWVLPSGPWLESRTSARGLFFWKLTQPHLKWLNFRAWLPSLFHFQGFPVMSFDVVWQKLWISSCFVWLWPKVKHTWKVVLPWPAKDWQLVTLIFNWSWVEWVEWGNMAFEEAERPNFEGSFATGLAIDNQMWDWENVSCCYVVASKCRK